MSKNHIFSQSTLILEEHALLGKNLVPLQDTAHLEKLLLETFIDDFKNVEDASANLRYQKLSRIKTFSGDQRRTKVISKPNILVAAV